MRKLSVSNSGSEKREFYWDRINCLSYFEAAAGQRFPCEQKTPNKGHYKLLSNGQHALRTSLLFF